MPHNVAIGCNSLDLHPRRHKANFTMPGEETLEEMDGDDDDPSTVCHTNTPMAMSPRSPPSSPSHSVAEATNRQAEDCPQWTSSEQHLQERRQGEASAKAKHDCQTRRDKEDRAKKVAAPVIHMPFPLNSENSVVLRGRKCGSSADRAMRDMADQILLKAFGASAMPDGYTRQLWRNVHRELLRQSANLIKRRASEVPLEKVGTYPAWMAGRDSKPAAEPPNGVTPALNRSTLHVQPATAEQDRHLYAKSARLPRVPPLLRSQPYFRPASSNQTSKR